MQIAIRELKSHFSKYLKKVQEGEEIIVTTHGKPIARFSQLDINFDDPKNNNINNVDWIQHGNGSKPIGLSGNERIKLQEGKDLSDMLLEDRE